MVAIKCMKNQFDTIDQVNRLREIQALRKLSPQPHIVKLIEVLQDEPTGRLALVFELMDMNMQEAIRGRRHQLPESRVKHQMQQLLKAIDHMHKLGIFHRDIKPENILIVGDTLKLADFGSCRGRFSSPPFTEQISTRWQRAPECLLTDGYQDQKMDIWGVGCVFFEVLSLFALFPGTNELDQVNKIHNVLGKPPKQVLDKFRMHASHMDFNFPDKTGTGIRDLIKHVSDDCVDFIEKLLAYNPEHRLTSEQALKHPYFQDLRELDKRLTMNLNLSHQNHNDQNEKTLEDEEDGICSLRKEKNKVNKDSKKQKKLPKLNQMLKGSSDEESDQDYVDKSINLPKISNAKNNTKDTTLKNKTTFRTKKSQLNTNNSNASLNTKKQYSKKQAF